MKNDILTILKESIALLEQIPVTDTKDCYRKVLIHDKLALVHNCLEKAQIIEAKEESDGNKEDDTPAAD